MDLTVIVTAGGIGNRMGASLPKQFLLLNNRPILFHTIESFFTFDAKAQILVTLPEDWIPYWNELCEEYNFTIQHEVISGGQERYDSIKHALKVTKGDKVLVHDGVRPLVSERVIRNVLDSVNANNGVVPVLPLKSSIRKGTENESKAVNRSEYWMVQTPQGFSREVIKKAYDYPFSEDITDDSSLVAKAGYNIELVQGEEENIKITTPFDLVIAAKIIES
jgi:2-C-methyl-D-erythritol 4-phosphate cytidylyltransferase